MTKFLVTYHGGSMPSNPEEAAQMHEAFEGWLGRAGKAVVDPGAPLRPAGHLGKGAPSPDVGGYSVIEAGSAAEATEVLKSHPFVSRGGTLLLHESMDV